MPRVITLCALLVFAAAASAQEAELAQRIAKLERAMDNRGLLDLLREIESLKQEVQALRGQIENQNYALDRLKSSQTAGYVDLDRRLQGLTSGAPSGGSAGRAPLPTLAPTPGDAVAGTPAAQGNLRVETAPAPPAPGTPGTLAQGAFPGEPQAGSGTAPGGLVTEPVPPATVAPDGTIVPTPAAPGTAVAGIAPAPQAPVAGPGVSSSAPAPGPTVDDAASETAYRDAFGLLKAGEYDQAIAAFSDYLARYPQSQYGDNAQYWLAEAHYVKRDFELAIAGYQKMIANFPASKKLSHAMLKIGYSYQELGQFDQARGTLQALLQQYPGSAAARLAQERLAQIDAMAGAGASRSQ